jgi:hypothetical protein
LHVATYPRDHDVPSDRDVLLAVLEGKEAHALAFPCRRSGLAWIDAKSRRPIEVSPTHWDEWPGGARMPGDRRAI